jgi:uncharacterized membrane protein (UPF0127 family)
MRSFLQPIVREGAGGQRIVNTRNGKVVADRLLTAFDSATRRKGLLAHGTLSPSTALIIAPTNAIHTFFMKFPIDIVFVSKGGRVLKIRSRVPAWRMTASLRAYAVLELAAGALDCSDTQVGDQLAVSKHLSDAAFSR